MNLEMLKAREELGGEKFNQHYRTIFGHQCLDFVETIVINLPEPCYANCEYCIDKYLRKNTIGNEEFLTICEKVLTEFPNVKNVAITGGTLNYKDFSNLVLLIKQYLPNSFITWNTNGIGIDENYLNAISKINYINLHRNSVSEDENKKVFKTQKEILSIVKAKLLMGDKLFLIVTVDENFDIDEYIVQNIPLYLNRLLPGNKVTNEKFSETMKKLAILDKEVKRRNVYIDCIYKGIPVRLCLGDKISKCVPGREPTYLNVAIIHRSGIVCGSWYENDKVIYNPNSLGNELDSIEKSNALKLIK